MTADLAEEHSTATLATERLENEQADRLKLEKEKADLMVTICYYFPTITVSGKFIFYRIAISI